MDLQENPTLDKAVRHHCDISSRISSLMFLYPAANMMMFDFIYKYALSSDKTKDKALAIVPAGKDTKSVSDDDKNKVRALVIVDELNFASAAWFLKNTCDQKIRDGLKAGTSQGWEDFIKKCVSTTATPDRKKIYDAAMAALP